MLQPKLCTMGSHGRPGSPLLQNCQKYLFRLATMLGPFLLTGRTTPTCGAWSVGWITVPSTVMGVCTSSVLAMISVFLVMKASSLV